MIKERIRSLLHLPTDLERAYIRLYNGKITLSQFVAECGIQDQAEAWKTLREYREKVVSGEMQDPRDKYRKWT